MSKNGWIIAAVALTVAVAFGAKYALSSSPIEKGSKAPDFALEDQNGKTHKLSDYAGKPVALVFYPKDFTGGCTKQACSIRDSYDAIKKTGAVVFGISTDSVETHAKFAKEHDLPHTLLADTNGDVAKAYGVKSPSGLASRVTFLVGKDGTVENVMTGIETEKHGADLAGWVAEKPSAEFTGKIGEVAPSFNLPVAFKPEAFSKWGAQAGTSLAKNHKAMVVFFIATKCPVSLAYDARMNEVAKKFMDKGILFVGINPNVTEPTDEVAQHATDKKYVFPVLRDEGHAVADQYKAAVTPEAFVLDPNLKLVYHGRIDDSQNPSGITSKDLENALNDIVAGRAVAKAETKAFGCTIKRARR